MLQRSLRYTGKWKKGQGAEEQNLELPSCVKIKRGAKMKIHIHLLIFALSFKGGKRN